MLAPSLKGQIRALWNRFWSGGIANPLTAIEQITYLIFLKRLEVLDDARQSAARQSGRSEQSVFAVENGDSYRWSVIRRMPSQEQLRHIRGPVFDWMKSLPGAAERMQDAVFIIPSAGLLQGAIEIIENLYVSERNQDTLGDIYEMLLSEIAESGKNGQFRTPRHIIRAMCDLVDPRYGERICDPACGTAGFLVNAYQHILKSNTSRDILRFQADGTPIEVWHDLLTAEQYEELRRNHFYGWDFDRTMVRLGWMNMIQHGLSEPKINYADTLGSRFNNSLLVNGGSVGDFDVVLANPPFTGNIDKADIGDSLQRLGTTKTELLFVELILQLLRTGGRAAVIVPEGLLFGSTNAHRTLRRKLVQENQLNAVISLPGGVFQPYTGVKTSILLFAKGGSTEQVWFYEVSADGYTLNAKRDEDFEHNDLWDMTLKYRLRHAATLAQPIPAFVDGDTWRDWSEQSPAQRSFGYLQPRFQEVKEEVENEQVTALELAGFNNMVIQPDKNWEAATDALTENDLNLSAGRYKPFSLETVEHDPPAQIIQELQNLEQDIQKRLGEFLALLENQE